jgi:hypothetical protein
LQNFAAKSVNPPVGVNPSLLAARKWWNRIKYDDNYWELMDVIKTACFFLWHFEIPTYLNNQTCTFSL